MLLEAILKATLEAMKFTAIVAMGISIMLIGVMLA